MRRKLEDRNTRKIYKHGVSYAITLPKEFMRELAWRDGQKIVVKKRGDKLIIQDWEK